MAYNRRYFLQRVVEVQDTAWPYIRRGVTQKYVYENYIKGQFKISFSTFSNWMGIPAKAELRKLEETETNFKNI